jgi:hypothetical protein
MDLHVRHYISEMKFPFKCMCEDLTYLMRSMSLLHYDDEALSNGNLRKILYFIFIFLFSSCAYVELCIASLGIIHSIVEKMEQRFKWICMFAIILLTEMKFPLRFMCEDLTYLLRSLSLLLHDDEAIKADLQLVIELRNKVAHLEFFLTEDFKMFEPRKL